MTGSLPQEVQDVFTRFVTTECTTIDAAGRWSSAHAAITAALGRVFGARYTPTAWHHPRGAAVAIAEDVGRAFGAQVDTLAEDERPGGRDGVEVDF